MADKIDANVEEPQGTETQAEETENKETVNTDTDAAEQSEINWKAESRKWENRSKENAALAAKWKEHEDSFKTEEQKRLEELETYKREAELNKLEALRYKIATDKGIPSSAFALLEGNSEEELQAKADAIVSLLSAQQKSPAPVTTQGKGNSKDGGAQSLATWLENNIL